MSERRPSIGERIFEGIHHAAEYATGAIFNTPDDDAPNSMSSSGGDSDKYGVKSASPEGSTGASAARAHQMAH